MAQQTAVEWLCNEILKKIIINPTTLSDWNTLRVLFNDAKEIEKLQVINAFKTGEYNSVDYFNAEYPHQECSENYYNETYKK